MAPPVLQEFNLSEMKTGIYASLSRGNEVETYRPDLE